MTRPAEASTPTAVPARIRWSLVFGVALAALVAGVGVGAWWHADTLHVMLGLVVGAGSALLAAVSCVVMLVGAFRKKVAPRPSVALVGGAPVVALPAGGHDPARLPVALCLWGASTSVFGAVVVSLIAGIAFENAYLSSAKAWCEAQVPAVDAFHARNGRYPRTLQEIQPERSVPWVVETFDPLLHADESGVVFDLHTAFVSGWSFDSARREWSHYD